MRTGARRMLWLTAWLACPLGAAMKPGMPLRFEPNRGQADPQAVFVARAAGGLVLLGAAGEAVYLLPADNRQTQASAVKIQPLGGARPEVRAEGLLEGRSHYFRGHRSSRWITGVPAYARVRYRNLYPGIDLIYFGRNGLIEYDFEVAPGADPRQIRLQVSGPVRLRLASSGELFIAGEHGELRHRKPLAFQPRDGKRVPAPVSYRLEGPREVAFQVGDYDRSLPLVIDPPLVYASYLGGRRSDAAYGLAVDASGAAYVVGETFSTDFPVQQPLQSSLKADRDAFIAKFNATGTTLLYATFIGGSQSDRARAVALDNSGNAYVTGFTTSADFPVTVGVLNRTYRGLEDGFVVKISPSGALAYSTYLGAGGSDFPVAVSVDATGNAYVAGYTSSVNFPVTSGAFQTVFRGGYYDGFIAKLNPSGSALLYSTYLGGSGNDTVRGISVDSTGAAYLSGQTTSNDFPVLNAFQASSGGSNDAFLTKLNANGSALVYSTYLGGMGPDQATAIALDPAGRACITGATASINFPVTPGAFRSANAGGYDAFAACFEPAGNLLSFSTLLGGASAEEATGIAANTGVVWIAGYTQSANFPLQSAFQAAYKGNTDAFVAALSASGDGLLQASFLGGSGYDTATALALDGAGNLHVAGWTFSADFPVTEGSFRTSAPGAGDAFLAKLASNLPPAAVSVSPSSGTGWSQTFRVTASDPNGFADIGSVHVLIRGTLDYAQACYVVYAPATRQLWLVSDQGNLRLGPITAGTPATLENSQCTLSGSGSGSIGSGNLVTVDLPLTFKTSFAGRQKIYVEAHDNGGMRSEWRELGAWTVGSSVNSPPEPVSVSPSSGAGWSQTFRATVSDPNGWADIGSVHFLVNGTLGYANGCYLAYGPVTRQLWLVSDQADAWLGPLIAGTSGTLENSQCAVSASGSGGSGSGNTVTAELALSFKSSFAGQKKVYVAAYDYGGLVAGWRELGAWRVGSGVNSPPEPVSVSPSSGAGWSETFRATVSDPDGFADIGSVHLLIHSGLDYVRACYLAYGPVTKQLWLVSDQGNAWLGPLIAGTSGTLENSQCAVSASGSGSSGSDNTVTAELALSFKSSFAGQKKVYLAAYDYGGLVGGWRELGAWTVGSSLNQAPSVVSVTPSSGAGANQTFSFLFADPDGASDLRYMFMLFGDRIRSDAVCLPHYDGSNLWLVNDAGTGWLGPLQPGGAGVLENSQCAIDGSRSSVTASGLNLTVQLAISFKSSFRGTKTVYMQATDRGGLDTGMQPRGSWEVP